MADIIPITRKIDRKIEQFLADNEELVVRAMREFVSWWCDQCSVEVYRRRCPHCGKKHEDKA